MTQAICQDAKRLYYITYPHLSLKHTQEAARVTTSICKQLKNYTLPIVKINEMDNIPEDVRNSLNMSVPDHWHIFSTIDQKESNIIWHTPVSTSLQSLFSS